MALPASPRLGERLRGDARSLGGAVHADPRERHRAKPSALPAGQPGAGDHLADADRLASGLRLPGHPAVERRGEILALPSSPRRLRGRGGAVAGRHLRRRRRRADPQLHADVRLRPRARRLELRGGGLRAGQGSLRQPRSRATTDHQPAPRADRPASGRPGSPQGGRERLRGALVGRSRATDHRGGPRAGMAHHPDLAPVAEGRHLPGSRVAKLPGAQRPDPQGPQLRAHRGDPRRRHHVASGDAGRGAQLGLPLHLDQGLRLHALGAVHTRVRVGGVRVLRLHARHGGPEPASDHVRDRR